MTLVSDPSPVVDPPLAASPLLVARGLAVHAGALELVSHVDLEAYRGECLGIVGETGSGKSVTCRAITGSLPRHGARASGELRFDGLELTALDGRGWRALRGRRIALVPQGSLTSLDPVMRIGAQLRETVRVLGAGADPDRRALELLELVEMPRPRETLRKYPHELSGGMRQRAMIALAIAGSPELLVADEPTTALDVTVQRNILRLLRDLCRDEGLTLILVTHDLAVIEEMAQRLAVVYAGMTVERGPAEQVLSSPQHPYTRALLRARLSALTTGQRLAGIPGAPPSAGLWPAGCRFADRCPDRLDACVAAPPPSVAVGPEQVAACVRAGGAA